jgi:pimeloyl-ACP methyl ester carboxylesterase
MNVAAEMKTALSGSISTGYLDAGAGETVILLHGMGTSAKFWQPVISTLASRFRVIAPDLAGFAGSAAPPRDGTWPSYSSWLSSFMDVLGITEAHLVGHSLGGAIALRFALDHPSRVSRLVLVDSIGLGSGPMAILSAILFTLPSNPVSRAVLRRVLTFGAQKISLPPAAKKSRQPAFDRRPILRLLAASGWRGLPRIPNEELELIRQPTLLIWGERDSVLPVSIALRARSLIPGASIVTIEAGHAPPIDCPETFASELMEFLATARRE